MSLSFGQTLGSRLRWVIKESQVQVKEVCEKLGISTNTLYTYFNDKSSPSVDFVIKFAGEFPNINKEWVFTGQGEVWAKPSADGNPTGTLQSPSENKEGADIQSLLKERSSVIEALQELIKEKDKRLHYQEISINSLTDLNKLLKEKLEKPS